MALAGTGSVCGLGERVRAGAPAIDWCLESRTLTNAGKTVHRQVARTLAGISVLRKRVAVRAEAEASDRSLVFRTLGEALLPVQTQVVFALARAFVFGQDKPARATTLCEACVRHWLQNAVLSAVLHAALPVVAQVAIALARIVRSHCESGEAPTHSVIRRLETRALGETVLPADVQHSRALAVCPVCRWRVAVCADTLAAAGGLMLRAACEATLLVHAQGVLAVARESIAGRDKAVGALALTIGH